MESSQQLHNFRRSIMRVNRQSNAVSPRRQRAILSCATCRKRKIRCDRLTPCSQCVRSKIADSCYYPLVSSSSTSSSSTAPRASNPTPWAHPSVQPPGQYIAPPPTADEICEAHDLDHPESHEHISEDVPNSSNLPNSSLSWPSSIDPIQLLSPLSFRGKDQKTRFFGRSHWAMTLSM